MSDILNDMSAPTLRAVVEKAIAEIDTLLARVEELEEALTGIVSHCEKNGMQYWPVCIKARAILKGGDR